MSFRGDLEAVILGTLQGERLHGYEISKRITQKSEGLLKVGEGQLYPVLHKLEEQGFVSAEWESTEGKPARKVYALTQQGRAALAAKLERWERFAKSIGAILASPKEALDG